MKSNGRTRFLSVCFGKSETAVLDKAQNLLEIHTDSQKEPVFIASGMVSNLKLRDLLIDAYPLEKFTLRERAKK